MAVFLSLLIAQNGSNDGKGLHGGAPCVADQPPICPITGSEDQGEIGGRSQGTLEIQGLVRTMRGTEEISWEGLAAESAGFQDDHRSDRREEPAGGPGGIRGLKRP